MHKRILFIGVCLAVLTSAHSAHASGKGLISADSLLPVDHNVLQECMAIEAVYSGSVNKGCAFQHLLKLSRLKKMLKHEAPRRQLYADLASISARMSLYPFAMQCYYQSTLSSAYQPPGTALNLESAWLNQHDSSLLKDSYAAKNTWRKSSRPVRAHDIVSAFNDGKEVLACAILLHVKQPVPGKRKIFSGFNNVGHSFITLIKYNTDSSYVSRSFGFYPSKSNLFSATPLQPSSQSVFRDDGLHEWDEIAGKFISYRQLQKILKLLVKFQDKNYNLNLNNCTDFTLYAAMASGIEIENTQGKWPLGKGNNPASTGQSLLDGTIKNLDSSNDTGLFLSNGETTSLRPWN